MEESIMLEIARKRAGRKAGLYNAGWAYDMLPNLPTLDAGATIILADLEGPGVVTAIHFLQHIARLEDSVGFILEAAMTPVEKENETRRTAARGLVLEVFYDHQPLPAICCPLADFFADGCGGKAVNFTSPFVEKVPDSHNTFFPMPFRESILIRLRNETPFDLLNYCFVEHERLPAWTDDLLYFHAAWDLHTFSLTPDTVQKILHIDGGGHLVGQHFSIITHEPAFRGFFFVMEGNPCYTVDGEANPSFIYTGMEDSFGFSWGFRSVFSGAYNGINHLEMDEDPNELSIYRFRPTSPLIFQQSLDLEINWQHEFSLGQTNYNSPPRQRVRRANQQGGGIISLAATHYWYADSPTGRAANLPNLSTRLDHGLQPSTPRS
jgi:hypothetical protein